MPRRQDENASWRPHDTDRGIDPYDDDRWSTRPPSSRPAVPPPSARPAARPAASRPRPAPGRTPDVRTVMIAAGGVLAVAATLLVFLTDDVDLLRVAVVAAAWAFVLATFVAGRRRGEQAEAAAREATLRRTYEHELEREVAARREYELELEADLRAETEQAVRAELDALREELSGVTELRQEVARVSQLRDDVAALAGLRDEVARVAALRDEVARVAALREDVLALTSLRAELGQVGELRAEVGRLRVELTEQLSSEMLVERITMRTQAQRLTGEPSWRDEPPRELTGGWPAVRLDEHTGSHAASAPGTQQYERVRVERPAPPAPWEPGTSAMPAIQADPYAPPAAAYEPPAAAPAPLTAAWPLPPVPARPEPAPWTEPEPSSRHSRHAADDEPPPSPIEWLSARALVEPEVPATAERPRPSPHRRRTDEPPLSLRPDDVLTTERPRPAPSSADYPFGSPPPPPVRAEDSSPGHNRLERILAESGVQPATGGRRRRRYRDDDGSGDDVLTRVLRGQ